MDLERLVAVRGGRRRPGRRGPQLLRTGAGIPHPSAGPFGTVNGSANGTAGNDTFTTVTLQSAGTGANYNFGELPGSSVAGRVFAPNPGATATAD